MDLEKRRIQFLFNIELEKKVFIAAWLLSSLWSVHVLYGISNILHLRLLYLFYKTTYGLHCIAKLKLYVRNCLLFCAAMSLSQWILKEL